MSPRDPRKSAVVPYKDSTERLLDEVLRWVPARVARIAAEGEKVPLRSWRRPPQTQVPPECVKTLREEEDRIRAEINARVAASGSMAFDEVYHTLDAFEQTTLLLSAVGMFGSGASEQCLWPIEATTTAGTVDAETVWTFLGLHSADRLASLLKLLPTAPVRERGLVRLNYEATSPADLATVGIELTGKGLAALTGVPEYERIGNPTQVGEKP